MDTSLKSPGRPKLPDTAKRTMAVVVRFSPEEFARLAANAQYAGRSRARFVRESALAACVIDPPAA